jgi:hypothetical protein
MMRIYLTRSIDHGLAFPINTSMISSIIIAVRTIVRQIVASCTSPFLFHPLLSSSLISYLSFSPLPSTPHRSDQAAKGKNDIDDSRLAVYP